VDLSADFRLRKVEDYEMWYDRHPMSEQLPGAVFGLPELHRDEIASARLVAGPGCHATAAIIALAPAIKYGLIESDIIVDSKAGISGAGRALGLAYHFSEANENVTGYSLGGHRHLPEMVQELGALWEGPAPRITFVPHLIPATRGILVTCYASLKGAEDTERVRLAYEEFYAAAPFVRVVSEPPSMKHTLGTNDCLVYLTVDARTDRLIAIACLDNLIKGGAGQGVQCLNLMLGLPEAAGLERLALYP
jgi:N-acetyl-gamma-glutamyl-phosphate reductase